MLNPSQLLGQDSSHLAAVDDQQLEKETASAFKAMQSHALQHGFSLRLCSGWRSFERQLKIFNAKARQERPLFDRNNQLCDVNTMSSEQILEAILGWSALPGLSRHHWGTDLDWFDGAKVDKYALQLEPWEYQPEGPCYGLAVWLEEHMERYGFFRPYREDLGGVAPEPWHLSFAPVSYSQPNDLDLNHLATLLERSDIELKALILRRLPELAQRYCFNITPPLSSQ